MTVTNNQQVVAYYEWFLSIQATMKTILKAKDLFPIYFFEATFLT